MQHTHVTMRQSTESIARLKEKLTTTASTWERIPLLIALSKELSQYNSQRAYEHAREGLRLAKSIDSKFWVAVSLHAIGISLSNTARYTETLAALEEASRIFHRINDPRRKAETDFAVGTTLSAMGSPAKATIALRTSFRFFSQRRNYFWLTQLHCALGDVAVATGEYGKGLRYYKKALRNSAKVEQMNVARIYFCLAVLYKRIGDTDLHRKYLKRSLVLYKQSDDQFGVATAISALVPLSIAQNAYAEAERYIKQAEQIFHEFGCSAQKADLWRHQGNLFAKKGEYRNGLQAFGKGIALAKRSEDRLLLARLYTDLGLLHIQGHAYHEGLQALHNALVLLQAIGDPYYLYPIYQALANGYEQSDDPEQALKYYKYYNQTKERCVDGRKLLNAGRIEMRSRIRSLAIKLRKENRQKKHLRQSIEEKDIRLTSLTLQLVQTSERLHKKEETEQGIEEEITEQNQGQAPFIEESWNIFARQFNVLHPEFYARLMNHCPALTSTELKVCSLIHINLSSCQIADLLSISKRTVDRHRENIRAKLNLPSRQALSEALNTI